MKRTAWMVTFVFPAAVAMLSCQQQAEAPASEPPPAAVADTGPDPTVVDAAHYKVELENDRMRVIRIQYGPGEESVMHYHPAGMAVFLTPAHGSFELPDGTTQPIDAEAGQAMLLPAGQHKPSNLGDEGFEVVQVELKDVEGGAAGESAEAETGSDPTVVDAAHYTVDAENDQLRVVRIKYGPGETSVMHYHPAGVAVFLSPAHGSFELPDGTTQPIDAEAGQAMLLPAGQHKPSNLGDEGFEVVQVELKD